MTKYLEEKQQKLEEEESQMKKMKIIKEEEQESEEVESKRIKGKEEMEMGNRPWTEHEKQIFDHLLRDFRRGDLNSQLPNNDLAQGVNFWDLSFWQNLTGIYNQRADVHGLTKRDELEILLRGEVLHNDFTIQSSQGCITPILNEIFGYDRDCSCYRIPVFPVSVMTGPNSPQSIVSDAESSVAGCGASSAIVGQLVNLICHLNNEGLLTTSEVADLILHGDKWLEPWVHFLLAPEHPNDLKARHLKSILGSGSN